MIKPLHTAEKNSRCYAIIASLVCLLAITSCDSPVDQVSLGTLEPKESDSIATLWKPFLGDSVPNTILAAPGDNNEGLAEVKNAVAAKETQTAAINRWNTGAIYVWSNITRGIIAKHNIAPLPEKRLDGSFTGRFLPDPNKPFSNPPFSSRMCALISVAQYDALLKAWDIKYEHRRLRPYQADPSIARSGPDPLTPSYPNEDAVISRAVVEVLAFFYPLERANLEAQLKECNNSRIAAGLARPSDIAGGDSLGKVYANMAIAYSKLDNFSKADDQARWRTTEAAMKTDYPRWKSIETPARPPMLPFYGEVKTWNIVSGAALDPGPPPNSSDEAFKKDLEEIRMMAKGLTTEQQRVADYWADGEGTATPPGHWWYDFVNEKAHGSAYSAVRYARVMAYTATALHDAGVACWATKYKYATARPITLDPEGIRMHIGLPNFPGYSSGHSTFSGAAATVLSHFFPADAARLNAMAVEAGDSRVYGCIHVRTDCTVGLAQGKIVGKASVDRAKLDE